MSESASAESKAGGIIDALERFFLDVIGTILPGGALLTGYCYILQKPLAKLSKALVGHESQYDWVIFVAFAYILGHGVTSLGYKIAKKLEKAYKNDEFRSAFIDNVEASDKSKDHRVDGGALKASSKKPEWILSFVSPQNEVEEDLGKDPLYKAFLNTIAKKIPLLREDERREVKPQAWRSMAMSIAPEQNQLVYRFMFIALLNLGIATTCICLCVLWAGGLFLSAIGAPTGPVVDFNPALIILAIAPYFFLERFYDFNKRAFKLPFSIALAKLAMQSEQSQEAKAGNLVRAGLNAEIPTGGKRLRIYLAGGFKSGWQDSVINAANSFDYFDPRTHGLTSKKEYTAWDLEAIRRCDCVFAYLESTNPGGYALALEIGFAKALGKLVIFIDEKSAKDSTAGRYLEMATETADVYFKSLQEGIDFLGKCNFLQ